MGTSVSSDRFVQIASFPVVVPEDYDHATCLAKFRRKHESEFAYYNGDITDPNFVRATTKLTPGRRFTVKVFQKITRRVSSEDCLALIQREQGVLVGAAGATLAYEQGKGHLPKGRWHISFDKKEALWVDADGYHRVPRVLTRGVGGFEFGLGRLKFARYDDFCALCFCEEET